MYICIKCLKRKRVVKVTTIGGCLVEICPGCVAEFDKITDFHKIPKEDQAEAFEMFCRSSITVIFRDKERNNESHKRTGR